MESIPFPDDLVQAQRLWFATYRELAAPRPRRTTALRRRLLALSVRLQWHPFWSTPPGRGPGARVELRRLARRQEQYERRSAAG
ncbi:MULTISPECIES: hypothetical protein [unclassified Streptomyces]|uniref:hypothetical protein n=1 Tax=unclassified Streptomyces TaxID=2593676 RepID=UPI0020349A6E|nr:hypothetical protein [Streptomyces sp. RKAG290]MCM2412160.1 hypothetical protein [Streptomyces sp. RKAG290]